MSVLVIIAHVYRQFSDIMTFDAKLTTETSDLKLKIGVFY